MHSIKDTEGTLLGGHSEDRAVFESSLLSPTHETYGINNNGYPLLYINEGNIQDITIKRSLA